MPNPLDDHLIKDRYEKLQKIRALGVSVYPDKFKRTHTSVEALELAEKGVRTGEEVHEKNARNLTVAGRITSLRSFGKLTFAHILDNDGKIQIAFQEGHMDEKSEALSKLIDVGDFIGVTGELFKTKHGEITVFGADLTFLGKALRHLPEKFHGLQDQETKYRQRYLDLISDPETKKRFMFRSNLIKALREFYWKNDFTEIDSPVLETISGGTTAQPFITHHNALDIDVYLRIAAGELWHKMAVVGGFEKVFEVSRCFRNEGMDPSHLQEFTMIESYGAYWDFKDSMKFVEKMLSTVLKKLLGTTKVTLKDRDGQPVEVDFKAPWPRVEFCKLIKEDCGIDVLKYKDATSLLEEIRAKGIQIEDAATMGYGNLVDHLYKKVSRPKLIQPTFVIKHPIDTKPLARVNDKDPRLCDTFQLLVGTWEIVNAYSELVDPLDQRARFERQSMAKAGGDKEAMEMNEEYLTAMEHGMPPISGLGMGIDRLLALLTQQENLRDVVMFPLMRPEGTSARQHFSTPSTISSAQSASSAKVPDKIDMLDTLDINVGISLPEAFKLVQEKVQNPAILNHSKESAAVMAGLAKRLGANEESWAILGLLHDIDWDPKTMAPHDHGTRSEEILKEAGVTPEAIAVIKSHIYGAQGCAWPNEKRTRRIEHALACGETVTGLIHASALVRPEKKVAMVELKSVLKKFKEKSFAAGVNRDFILECEKLGLTLEEFMEIALKAIQEIGEDVGL